MTDRGLDLIIRIHLLRATTERNRCDRNRSETSRSERNRESLSPTCPSILGPASRETPATPRGRRRSRGLRTELHPPMTGRRRDRSGSLRSRSAWRTSGPPAPRPGSSRRPRPRCSSASTGTTSVASPIRRASSASTIRPDSANSFALCMPTIRAATTIHRSRR